MGLLKRFEDLQAWQEARRLTAQAYQLTRGSGFARDPGMTDEVRRAAVSCMNNVAEGFDSGSRIEFRRFLRYAARSASEVQSCLYVASDQDYVDPSGFSSSYEQAQAVRKLRMGLTRRLGAGKARSTGSPAHRLTGAPERSGG
jgi:four helix bundle protein